MPTTVAKLITPAEAAELLGVSDQTLADWRFNRQGPPFYKLGHRTVRYPYDELVEWLDRQRRDS